MEKFPALTIDMKKLRENYRSMIEKCKEANIKTAGVIKGCSGIPECIKIADEEGCDFIASSRLDQLETAKKLNLSAPLMLIRIPMLSEIHRVIEIAEYSLESEMTVLKALDAEAKSQGKKHKVILMSDLGDLREGFWNKEELLQAALLVENDLDNLELAGVGTNLGCYGSIVPTAEKLKELVQDCEMIEEKIGRKLELISGGATSSIERILKKDMPERINMLRIGEAILVGRAGPDFFDFMHKDVFKIVAEVIEIKDKPSYPVGEIGCDAFGFYPEYKDRGIRKRAIVALGKVDYVFPEKLEPEMENIQVLGASSDHTILDVEDYEGSLKIGDKITFNLCYGTLVYASAALIDKRQCLQYNKSDTTMG